MNKLTKEGLDLIKHFESCRLKAYYDSGGVLTIGWGHTSAGGAPEVKPGMVITQAQADEIFKNDLKKFEKYVQTYITVPLNDNQYSALVSFCYNVGPVQFKGSSVRSYTNQKRFSEVPSRLALWNKDNGKVLNGLIRRRKAEGELFLKPTFLDTQKPVQPIPDDPGVLPSEKKETSPDGSVGFWRALFDIILYTFKNRRV